MQDDSLNSQFTWRAHPAKLDTRKTAGALLIILILSITVYLSFDSLLWSLFALGILFITLNRYFFASSFTIDSTGITASYPLTSRHFDWVDIKSFGYGQAGGILSTRQNPTRWDSQRGLQLYFNGQRETVIELINRNLAAAAK
ncbi:MAG: hypothetical protein ABIA75_00845 [Candidatus Neomarinimicrobiota bacterium]